MIYFIQQGEAGAIKIGCSKCVRQRIKGLQNDSSEKLTLLHVIDGDFSIENHIHFRLKKHHIGGEWFKNNKDIMRYIMFLPKSDKWVMDRLEQDYHEGVKVAYRDNQYSEPIAISLRDELDKYEKMIIELALETFGYNISLAARKLDISRPTLHDKINKYNIRSVSD